MVVIDHWFFREVAHDPYDDWKWKVESCLQQNAGKEGPTNFSIAAIELHFFAKVLIAEQ